MNPRILLVSDNRMIRRRVTLSMASLRAKTECCAMDREAVHQQLARGPQICIIDAEADRQDVIWLLDLLSEGHKDISALLIANDHDQRFLHDLLARRSLNNLIARRGGLTANSDIIDENELIVTCQKLLHNDIFGIDKYLPWGVTIEEQRIASTRDKALALADLRQFLEAIECHASVAYLAGLAADELITNSIYNAPRDASGQPKYRDLDRRRPLSLEPHEEVLFRYGCDGRHMALSVTDRFGSIDRDVIVRYLDRCFTGEPIEAESIERRDKLGLYMVFSAITQLTFNIHVGVSTEAIALFYIRHNNRIFRSSGRSLNIFLSKEPPAEGAP